MNYTEAIALAHELMDKHGLPRGLGGWRIAFNQRKTAFGMCNYQRRAIFLSAPLTAHATREQVEQTLAHEIAHALTPRAGHGPVWRAKMREMGYRPDRCGEASAEQTQMLQETAKYVMVCSVTEKVMAYRHRRTNTAWACRCHNKPVEWKNNSPIYAQA